MQANAIVDFIVGLLHDPSAFAAFELDPQAALEQAGLGGVVTPEAVHDVLPVVADSFGAVSSEVSAAAGFAPIDSVVTEHSELAALDADDLFGTADLVVAPDVFYGVRDFADDVMVGVTTTFDDVMDSAAGLGDSLSSGVHDALNVDLHIDLPGFDLPGPL